MPSAVLALSTDDAQYWPWISFWTSMKPSDIEVSARLPGAFQDAWKFEYESLRALEMTRSWVSWIVEGKVSVSRQTLAFAVVRSASEALRCVGLFLDVEECARVLGEDSGLHVRGLAMLQLLQNG